MGAGARAHTHTHRYARTHTRNKHRRVESEVTRIHKLSNIDVNDRSADGRGLTRAVDRSWIPCSISLFRPLPPADPHSLPPVSRFFVPSTTLSRSVPSSLAFLSFFSRRGVSLSLPPPSLSLARSLARPGESWRNYRRADMTCYNGINERRGMMKSTHTRRASIHVPTFFISSSSFNRLLIPTPEPFAPSSPILT